MQTEHAIFFYNSIYNGISHSYFCKSFITVDHYWSDTLSSTGIASSPKVRNCTNRRNWYQELNMSNITNRSWLPVWCLSISWVCLHWYSMEYDECFNKSWWSLLNLSRSVFLKIVNDTNFIISFKHYMHVHLSRFIGLSRFN